MFTFSAGAEQPPDLDGSKINVQWGIRIPLRDKVQLAAKAYLPKIPTEAPCILVLTPYIELAVHASVTYFAAHGYPVFLVDTRGRGDSGGQFHPFLEEANDGYDVVEWLGRQPYCHGKVGMYSGSYMGYDQWAAAREIPPHLATIVPGMATSFVGRDFYDHNNIVEPGGTLHWLTIVNGKALQIDMYTDSAFWTEKYREWFESGRPLREFDAIVGYPSNTLPSKTFQEWLSHPYKDAYWDSYDPTPAQYRRISIPILTMTGAYDTQQGSALSHYKSHMTEAPSEARARHYLIIGPWDHGGTLSPATHMGGLTLGPNALLDTLKLHLQWYAWTMQNGPKPEFLMDHVAYYVIGAEKWRYAPTLEDVTARSETYFLHSVSNANDVFSSGSLGATPPSGQPDWYLYDPREIRGPELDAAAYSAPDQLFANQSLPLALGGRELVYHSAPFDKDTEISGFFKFSAWIAIDCPDTDLYASLYEIRKDGTSIILAMDAIRARYREGLRTPKLVQTTAPQHYNFDSFTFVSREIMRGSRLRLVIAPMGYVLGAEYGLNERNFNAGGVVAEESAKDARPVTVTLFHDQNHPSALYVPLGKAYSPAEPIAPPSAFTSEKSKSD